MRIYWNRFKKITPFNMSFVIRRSTIAREWSAVRSEIPSIWKETYGIINQIIFFIKVLLLVLPLFFILFRAFFISLGEIFNEIKGFVTKDVNYESFPFLHPEINERVVFVNSCKPNTNVGHREIVSNIDNRVMLEEEDFFEPNRRMIAKSARVIRKALIKNDYKLEGFILSTKFPNIKIERLLELVRLKKFDEVYLIQKIDFGIQLNKAIHELFGDIILRHKRSIGSSYLILKDNDVNKLENSIRKVFMNDKVKIKLTDIENKGGKQ